MKGLPDTTLDVNDHVGPWKLAPLESFCDIKSSAMSYAQLENSGNAPGGIRVLGVKVSDMNAPGNELELRTSKLERLILPSEANRRAIPERSIVFPKRGAAIATNKKRLTVCRTVLDPNLIAVTPREEVDYLFLFYWFHTLDLRKITEPGPTPQLNKKNVAPLLVPLPPLAEQKKIAHVLSTVQRAIEAQERIIQTTTELKKALMHKLFTEGLHNEPQKQTEIGPLPESWEVVELGKFLQIKHGFAFNGELFRPSGEFVLMTPGHFNEEGGFRDQGEKTKYFVGDFPREYLLQKDDLLVAMTEQKSGLLGSAALVPQSGMYLHNQRLGLIAELDEQRLSKRFLFHLFNTPHLRIEVAKTATGSKVKHTSPGRLRAVKVAIPPTLDEQEEIAFALNVTERRSETARRNASNLRVLFGCLLNNLISGHISARDIKPRHEATAGRACN